MNWCYFWCFQRMNEKQYFLVAFYCLLIRKILFKKTIGFEIKWGPWMMRNINNVDYVITKTLILERNCYPNNGSTGNSEEKRIFWFIGIKLKEYSVRNYCCIKQKRDLFWSFQQFWYSCNIQKMYLSQKFMFLNDFFILIHFVEATLIACICTNLHGIKFEIKITLTKLQIVAL